MPSPLQGLCALDVVCRGTSLRTPLNQDADLVQLCLFLAQRQWWNCMKSMPGFSTTSFTRFSYCSHARQPPGCSLCKVWWVVVPLVAFMLVQHMNVLPSAVLQVLVQLIILAHNQPRVLVSLAKSISVGGLRLMQDRGQVSNEVVLVTGPITSTEHPLLLFVRTHVHTLMYTVSALSHWQDIFSTKHCCMLDLWTDLIWKYWHDVLNYRLWILSVENDMADI